MPPCQVLVQPGSAPPFKHTHTSTPYIWSSGEALERFFSHHDKGRPQSRHGIHLHPMVFLHCCPVSKGALLLKRSSHTTTKVPHNPAIASIYTPWSSYTPIQSRFHPQVTQPPPNVVHWANPMGFLVVSNPAPAAPPPLTIPHRAPAPCTGETLSPPPPLN